MRPCIILAAVGAIAAAQEKEARPWLAGFGRTFPCDVLFVKGKKVAGTTWTAEDPWWAGHHARSLRFRADGTVQWCDEFPTFEGEFRWELNRFVPLDSPPRTVLRVSHTVLGPFPAETLLRHANWGYVWNSPWVVYSSFPMERATDDKSILDRALARTGSYVGFPTQHGLGVGVRTPRSNRRHQNN